MSNVTIRDIKVILTEPDGIRLVIVKVETSEPGLYGVGCATFTQRPLPVKVAVENYLRPFLIGRNVSRHRGHLAIELRQFVLAQRRRAQQRAERGGPSSVGHQGQDGRYAGVRPPGRPGAGGGRGLCARERQRTGRGGGQGERLHGPGIPSHPRPGRHARLRDLRYEGLG